MEEEPQPRSRILLVDDDPEELDILGEILREQGSDVVLANSIEEALVELERERFDDVYTDGLFGGWEKIAEQVSAIEDKPPRLTVISNDGGYQPKVEDMGHEFVDKYEFKLNSIK